MSALIPAFQSPQGQALLLSALNEAVKYGPDIVKSVTRRRAKKKAKQPNQLALRDSLQMQMAPAAIAKRAPTFQPKFNSVKGTYCVSNKEFLRNLAPTTSGSSELSVIGLTCQVGIAEMFPWLSTIANTHQRYRMKRLAFNYVPVAGTQTRGRVVMAFSIDPTEPNPDSMAHITQYPKYIANSVWTPMTLNVDLKDRNEELYTRSGFVKDTDIKTYDLGKLFVGISDTTDTNTIGQLFVDYEVELMTPKPKSCPSSFTLVVPAGAGLLFGNVAGKGYHVDGDSVSLEHDSSGNDFIRFEAPGTYLLQTEVTVTSGSIGLTIDDSTLDGDATEEYVAGNSTILLGQHIVDVNSNSRVKFTITGAGTFSQIILMTSQFQRNRTNYVASL